MIDLIAFSVRFSPPDYVVDAVWVRLLSIVMDFFIEPLLFEHLRVGSVFCVFEPLRFSKLAFLNN